jgi:DNA-binding NarL/FixJ family response regulator
LGVGEETPVDDVGDAPFESPDRFLGGFALSDPPLVVSMLEDDESVFAAMRAGARGYLLKGATQEATARAIRAVVDGETIFSPGIAERVMRFLSSPRGPESQIFPELTRRELEILALIAQGRTNPEIADALYVSLKTIQNHVSTIFTKLQVLTEPKRPSAPGKPDWEGEDALDTMSQAS